MVRTKEFSKDERKLLKSSKKAFKDSFGLLKGKIKKTGQEFKDELRRELYN